MRRGPGAGVFVALLALGVTGCEQVKSANPLSPAIAGPIAGVSISPPSPVEPVGSQIASDTQPVKLVVGNAQTNGVRPLSYTFEISADGGFVNKLFTQTGVTPGGSGKTTFVLPGTLPAERTYFWRAKAEDGANTGDYSASASFRVFTPIVVGVPTLMSPGDGATLTTLGPTLEVNNAVVTGPAGEIWYTFAISTSSSMVSPVVREDVPVGSSRTSFTSPALSPQTQYFWRARAYDPTHFGDWSNVRSFTTPAAPKVNPPPGGTGGSSGAPDAIPFSQITIALGADISGWAVTSTMTSAGHNGSDLCTDHTMAGRWPRLPWFDSPTLIEGNQWMFANIGGKWYGGAGEWMRPGQTCKNIDGHVGAGAFGGTAMEKWNPAPGETIGVAVSTPARAGQWGTAERSNIVLIKW